MARRAPANGLLCRWARFVNNNALLVLAGCTVSLLLLCLMAIRSERLDSDLMSWVQRSSRIEAELDFVVKSIKEGTGSNGQLLIQTPREGNSHGVDSVLSVEALMIHLEAMAIATHVTVDLDDVTWSLKDICFTPTLPDFDGPNVMLMMDSMMPCAIKTPLDCFWEGAKILGPEQPVRLSSLSPPLKWTSINPLEMVEAEQANHPHSSVPYQPLIDWMRRVGITTGYLNKPCLDPTDPNCPPSAPNKRTGQPPDIGAQLKGGCSGLASKQMLWQEDEIVGGLVKNSTTGDIISARGLQSTIQLMGEKDMYELWRKSLKVQDINNWSVEKAKKVLDSWQLRFKQELEQFARTSNATSPYRIHAMTSDSMLEPIDPATLRDPTNFLISFSLMTIMSCLIYPSFNPTETKPPTSDTTSDDDEDDYSYNHATKSSCRDGTKKEAHRNSASLIETLGPRAMKNVTIAVVSSIYIGLTFVASLGLSLFMELPINMATSQILPPIALYYGFNLFNTIVHIYEEKFKQIHSSSYSGSTTASLTRECLDELLPVVSIQTVCHTIAFLIATTIPVPATRILAFQAIISISMVSVAAILVMPPIMLLILQSDKQVASDERRRGSSKLFTVTTRDLESGGSTAARVSIEDQIFSRIQDDLKNIRADSRSDSSCSNNIKFSAELEVNGLRTSFRVSAPISRLPGSQPKKCSRSASTAKPAPEPEQATTKSAYIKWDSHGPMLSREPPDPSFESKEIFFKEENKAKPERSPIKLLTTNKLVQAIIITLFAVIFAGLVSFVPKVRHGLSIKDIVLHESAEYESWSMQEEQFPIYNIFAVTRGNFDYPNNQKLLMDFYHAIEQVDGIVRTAEPKNGTSMARVARPKFWLIAFRDWLLELQEKFDIDRNRSAISPEGWDPLADDASKLAFKLLAQTGRVDNPIDKSLIETNRLVDANNIINPKAFYYYLNAWIAHDPFSYSTTEANFEPEPKAVPGNPNDLKMDKARPLISAHMPFLFKLPQNHQDNYLKGIIEIRRISQSFEQLGLPNFPTGIPFIFWDQFINIDLLFHISLLIGALSMLLVVGMITSDCKLAAIVTFPAALTVLELHGYMGYADMPFNNVFAFLILTTLGVSTVPTIHYVTCFSTADGNLASRTQEALRKRSRVVVTNLLLFLVGNCVFYEARVDFMIKCSSLLLCVAALNLLKSILLTPVLLSLFGSKYVPTSEYGDEDEDYDLNDYRSSSESGGARKSRHSKGKQHVVKTKRNYPRVQSEISLSTISEEPQSENYHNQQQLNDLKIPDFDKLQATMGSCN